MYQVEKVAVSKLKFAGLLDAEVNQWLDININLDRSQFAILLSLRRWVDDLGYGLAGEITVWGLGGRAARGRRYRGAAADRAPRGRIYQAV